MTSRLTTVRNIRLSKIKKLRELGIDPYPSKPDKVPVKISEARALRAKKVSVVGRIWGWREHGGSIFADIKDETDKIQLFFQKKVLGQLFDLLNLLDIGDFIEIEGKVFKTEAGEVTINVERYKLLTKSLRPLPSTWYELKDVEERYRKRYLDLLLNPGVRERFNIRTKLVSEIRKYLDNLGFLEVETPTLQPVYGGGFARPFSTHHNVLDYNFYLRISDEMYLKRLIVGGFSKVYEITKVFRNEGIDRDHNPEFTMFEAMVGYEDYNYGMDMIEEIVEYTAQNVLGKTLVDYQGQNLDFKSPWKRLKLVVAVKEYAGAYPLKWKSFQEAKNAVAKLDIKEDALKSLKHMHTVGEIIAFVFEELVEEKLIQPTFIYDYPVEVSPLAKKCDDPRFTQRFEMFAAGVEFGNNYSELNDPVDLHHRFVEEKKREKAGFEEAHQTDDDYLIAIEHGMPPTCGIAIGIDRLVMLFTDAPSLKEVILFPSMRPQSAKRGEKNGSKR